MIGDVERLRERYRGCFGCGEANPVGLRLGGFTVTDDGTVVASYAPRDDHRGFDGILHGGIVATALDEAMAWAAMLTEGVLVFTAKLELRYRRPARTDARLQLRGKVVERRGRRLVIEGSLHDDDGPVADAEGLFLVTEQPDRS